ncbi:MAG TPA: COX15/CtaA family protein, partial [Chloroflexota bacterium]
MACYALGLAAEPITRSAADTPWGDAAIATLRLGIAGVTLGACIAAWLTRRDDASLLLAATLAPVLMAIRALSAALLMTFGLSTLTEVLSLGLGLLVLASLTWASTLSIVGTHPGTGVRNAQLSLFQRVGEVTALVVFALALSGGAVRAVGASWACGGMFPDCSGLGLLPFGRDSLADIQLYHRLLGYVSLGLVGWLAIEAFRAHRGVAGLGAASVLLVGATVLDAAVGAAVVLFGVPPLAEVAHTAATAATWSVMVGVIALAHRAPARTFSAAVVGSPPIGRERLRERGSTGAPSLLSAYIQLTKPRVMSLLLATTATAMLIAARGFPDLTIFVATLIGGALMSGGAGAINHYVDRDIDPLMGRTAWRPIPSGMISPRAALQFGIALAVIAGAVFVVFVNVLAAMLAFIGLLGYVFIYTLW